jgi:hypothetical protein
MRGRHDRCPKCATSVPVVADAPAVPAIARAATQLRVPLSEVDDRQRPQFDQFLDALAAAVLRLNLSAPEGPPADLYIPVTLNPGGRATLSALVDPGELMPEPAALAELFRVLFAVKPPVTRGPAAEATLVFAIRGGTQHGRV